jgi:hypothetical protein
VQAQWTILGLSIDLERIWSLKRRTMTTLWYGLCVDNLRVIVDSSLQIAEAVYVH